ncbi:gas vesicle protein [Halorarum salinum]|uniref:Gas vesicle protein n=1 Tax=Halorarum salinum TaxID=2743089 RepID=A0A7D5QFI2_9EURY|nr:gas vesicle protein [Halobaculum salinum]
MRPRKDEGALTDLVDVLLDEGVVLQADVVVSVAEVPLVGVNLRAAVAGMSTMTEYGFFEEWDRRHRERSDSGGLESTGDGPVAVDAGPADSGSAAAEPSDAVRSEPAGSRRSELRPAGIPDSRPKAPAADPGRHRPEDPVVPVDEGNDDDADEADVEDDVRDAGSAGDPPDSER